MKTFVLRIATAAFAAGLAAPAVAQDLADLAWLAGSWVERKDGVETEEHWLPPKGGMMVAMNRTVRGPGKRTSFELLRIDEAGSVCDLFRATDFQSLPALDRFDEHRSLQQRLVGASVQPGNATTEHFDL